MKLVWDELWRASSAWIPSAQILIRTRIHGDIQVFHFHFANSSDFSNFNRPALQEGAVCSWRLYGIYFRGDKALEWRRNRFQLTQELMEIFSFSLKFPRFCWFWGFQLASASGWSGLFMTLLWDVFERVFSAWISLKQIPIRIRIDGDIQVFYFHFADFADFEHFNWPALQEGAVCSWHLYGMHYRADRVLEFCSNRIKFAQELMEILMVFSQILLILLISSWC